VLAQVLSSTVPWRPAGASPSIAGNDLSHRVMLAPIGITVLIWFPKKTDVHKDAVLLMVKRLNAKLAQRLRHSSRPIGSEPSGT
jgi:hypothetical protein